MVENGLNEIRQDYATVFNNLDNMQAKFVKGEYVELPKSLPKVQVSSLGNRMELITKGG